MATYRAYGLVIDSAVAMRAPRVAAGEIDVTIRFGDRPARSEEQKVIVLANEAEYRIRGGRDLHIARLEGSDDGIVALHALGPAFAMLLAQRGLLVLHGSTVRVASSAVCFLGPPGSGKSTLAAAMHERGHAFVADDLTAVDLDHTEGRVVPGFRFVKLWPDSIRYFGSDPERHELVHPRFDKRVFSKRGRYVSHAVRLGPLYFLKYSDVVDLETLSPSDAVRYAIANTYAVRFLSLGGRNHLRLCGELLRRVPLRILHRPKDFRRTSEVVSLIERDVARLGHPRVVQRAALP